MPHTTVVFVHGFISSPKCWDLFVERLSSDPEVRGESYSFVRYAYPTEFLEWNPAKRIPSIRECGNNLGTFLGTIGNSDQLILVGHSMGGLVIQSFLAQKIQQHRGLDLAKIRSVVLFATPNRGSMILSNLRSIFSIIRSNPQEEDLKVLNGEIASIGEIIERSILGAKEIREDSCPIPFRVFWGGQDNVVPEASARGSFVEASCLQAGHSEIIQCDPKKPNDERYFALKDAILNPIGHPSTYEIDLLEASIAVSPASPETTFVLSDLEKPLQIHTDNVALRLMRIVFSQQNRCRIPNTETYRSTDGYVELLGLTEPNQALPETQSEYYSAGKKFSYMFTPDRGNSFTMKLRIYSGFGEGQRRWHYHMKPNANYKLVRLTLNLKDYHDAGYEIFPEPSLYFHAQNVMDHKLCSDRVFESPQAYLPSSDPWLRTWELPSVNVGVLDLVWDLKPKAV